MAPYLLLSGSLLAAPVLVRTLSRNGGPRGLSDTLVILEVPLAVANIPLELLYLYGVPLVVPRMWNEKGCVSVPKQAGAPTR